MSLWDSDTVTNLTTYLSKIENMRHSPLTIIAIAALALVGCGSTEAEEQPTSESEQQAQQNIDTSQQAYEEAYPAAESHIINEYGIMETAELCDNFNNHDEDFDYDAFIDNIMNDAAIEAEEGPEYQGARDATQDALYDTCEQTN